MKNTRQLSGLPFLVLSAIAVFPVSITTAFGQVQSPPTAATEDNGSIRGYFLANNGGVDFSIDPANPSGEEDEEDAEDRPDYTLLASLLSASRPTSADMIREAETNTDIDLSVIRTAVKESIGDLIFYRTYLVIGDLEAARFHSERLSTQMADIQQEVGFTAPIEQITLIDSSDEGEEELSNSGQRFEELEEREQQAIEEGRLPPNPTFATLNASDIYQLTRSTSENFGAMAATNRFGDAEETTFLANQAADNLLKIYYQINNFAVPLEQVQIIGSTAPAIEELKQAILQFGGGG
jgi:hypothetical protein